MTTVKTGGVDAMSEWRTGWPLVAATLVGITASIVQTFALGIFMQPLAAEFGWSRAVLSSPLLIMSVATLLLASAVGALADRIGPRRLALTGVPLAGIALASVGLIGASVWTWYLAWSFYAVLAVAVGPMAWTPAITRHFDVSRGLALAIGFCGSGLGAAMWPPLCLAAIEAFGWRGAFFAIGGLIGTVVWALTFVLFTGPATEPRPKPTAGTSQAHLTGMTLPQALRTFVFWRIGLMMMVTAGAVAAITVHLPSLLTDHGMTAVGAAGLMALLGPSLIVGRVAGGALLDRYPARFVCAGFSLIPAVSCLALIGYDGSTGSAIVAVVAIGMAAGVEGDMLAFLMSRFFGTKSFGAIYGVGLSIFGIGYGGAPTLAGALFDRVGSYDPGLIGLVVLLVGCAGIALSLGRYPDFMSDALSIDAMPGSAGTIAPT